MSLPWDDLRIFLAVARAGSLAGAARTLGVNHSTVFRRLNAFEDGLGVRLFERLPTGYALTVAGEEMRATAERVEREIERLDRRISGRDLRLEGSLLVTTTDTLAECVLMPHIARFRDAYPGIELELVLDNQNVNLSKRQADIAVRPTRNPPETLVGRRICDIAFAIYGADAYLQEAGADPAAFDWVSVDASLARLASDQWFRKTYPDAAVTLRANSLLGVWLAVCAGMGAAALPCFMGDARPNLRRAGGIVPEAATVLWLLTHEDLRHTARVRAFMDFMAEALVADIPKLEGRAG